MIRENKLVLSHRPYAVLGTIQLRDDSFRRVEAAWFRRRKGRTVACIGYLWWHNAQVLTCEQFVRDYDDNRYGGECLGRWDGEKYWGAQEPEVIDAHLKFLKPMLADYPAIPDGYTGWWVVPK